MNANLRAYFACSLHSTNNTANTHCLFLYVSVQVVDKDADAVLDEIEATILEVAQSILAGNGYSFDIPSRAKGESAMSWRCGGA
jgi:hypothetical protein